MFTKVCLGAARLLTHIKCFMMSLMPSAILEVVYIDPIEERVTTQYNAISNYFNWANHYANYLMENNGYYAFTVWDSHLKSKQCYFLSANMLCRVFHLRSLYSFWAYNDRGIVEILNQFMEFHRKDQCDLFALVTEDSDDMSADNKFKPFMKTLAMRDNATPKAILLFYNWLKSSKCDGDYIVAYEKLTVYNHDLDERDVALNEYLFTAES